MLNEWFTPRRPRWVPSEFSELPSRTMMEDNVWRDYSLLAGGLALLLSRCSPAARQKTFPHARSAHERITRQMKTGCDPVVPPHELSELAHEIAPYADRATREAARRCLQRALRRNAA